jgi:asparagine synthase (glutamine-hydrolysing)
MCGIFLYFGKKYSKEELINYGNKIVHRGPDDTSFINIKINDSYAQKKACSYEELQESGMTNENMIQENNLFIMFHRLAINGLNPESNQPFVNDGIYLICNGEIFNFKNLINEHNLNSVYKSESDCEVILHLYNKYGIEETCKLLDGEFAFVLYDSNKNVLYSARDQLGIRSLYWSKSTDGEICFASELKAIPHGMEYIGQFPPASYWSSDKKTIKKFYNFVSEKLINDEESEEEIIENIRILFEKAVEKRLMSDRKLACLLSGGLDSTTVSAIVANKFGPYSLNTYSIGLKGSIDLHYAKIAADYLKTNHVSIELNNDEFLGAIEKTIKQIESYDTTSVRASVGNYLVSLFIKEHSDDTVIFCGDVSDEIFASYRGFTYASEDLELYNENIGMLENINFFDVLRSDKSIAGAGLEARVPFSDIHFLKYCMSLHPKHKRFSAGPRRACSDADQVDLPKVVGATKDRMIPKDRIEKYLFRKAFEHLLPSELAWRVKTAFSDGVSNAENPWYEIIKEHMNKKYTDQEFEEKSSKYEHNTPYDKESLYYREVYESYYPNSAHTIPYFWKQPFMEEEDPSAWCAEKNNESDDIGVFHKLPQPSVSPAAPHPGQALLGAAENENTIFNI